MENKVNKKFKTIPTYSGYEINGVGELRKVGRVSIEPHSNLKGIRGDYYRIKGERIRATTLMLMAFNPLGIEDEGKYGYLHLTDLEFVGGEYVNNIHNIKVLDKGLRRMEEEGKPVSETHKEIVKNYWDYEKNTEQGIEPHEITKGAQGKIWVKCGYGHSYRETFHTLNFRGVCKYCNTLRNVSLPQQALFLILNKNFHNVVLERRLNQYSIDIYVEDVNLVVEYDGKHWHKGKDKIERDKRKEDMIKELWGSDIVRVRDKGCDTISSKGKVYTYDYKYEKVINNDFGDLKDIGYSIVREYVGKGKVLKVDEDDFRKLGSLLLNKTENLLSNKMPYLKEYYSNSNTLRMNEVSFSTLKRLKWECKECGYKWEESGNSISNKKLENICQNCKKIRMKKEREIRGNKVKRNKVKRGKEAYIKRKVEERKKAIERVSCHEDVKIDLMNVKEGDIYYLLRRVPNFSVVSALYLISDKGLEKRCQRLGIPYKTSYYTDKYKNEKGYTYAQYWRYVEYKNNREDEFRYVLGNYELKSKKELVERKKVVDGGVYDLIGLLHNKKGFTHKNNQPKTIE